MERTLRRIALAGAFLVPLAAVPAHAQDPTPEGTTITNQATASYTDANGNDYDDVTASVNVKVGFLAAPDITGPATATPASPTTGATASYTITNKGNGTDQVSLSFGVESGLTITGYAIGATQYATPELLNAALAGTDLDQNESVTVTVTYNVASGRGGQDLSITPTATSVRDDTRSDDTETVVTPPVSAGASVGASGGSSGGSASRLPSNGNTYTETFTLTNSGNATQTYTLTTGSSVGTVATVSGVTGTGVAGGEVTLLPGESVELTVTYTVASVEAGSSSEITVTATSTTGPAVTSTGTVTVTVIRAALAMTKVAYKANRTTVIDPAAAAVADRTVIPGETFYYRITVTNTGQAPADDVVVTDLIPEQLRAGFTAAAASNDVGVFGFAYDAATFTLTATLDGTLAASGDPGDKASFWVEVEVP